MLFLLSLSLTLRRRTVLMVFLLWFSKLVLPSLHPVLVNYFAYVFLLQPSLLARNVRPFSLCRIRETPLNPLITVQFLYPTFFLKFSNLSSTGRFGNISILLILSLIVSMAFVRNALLVIFFSFSLTLGHSLFGISVNVCCHAGHMESFRKSLAQSFDFQIYLFRN